MQMPVISGEAQADDAWGLRMVAGDEYLSSAGMWPFQNTRITLRQTVYLNFKNHLLTLTHGFAHLQLLIRGDNANIEPFRSLKTRPKQTPLLREIHTSRLQGKPQASTTAVGL